LDAGLRDGNLGRPLAGAEAGVRSLGKRPQPEVFRPLQLLGEHVVALSPLEREAQILLVKRTGGVSVPHDRSDAGYELDVHRLAPPDALPSRLPRRRPAHTTARLQASKPADSGPLTRS